MPESQVLGKYFSLPGQHTIHPISGSSLLNYSNKVPDNKEEGLTFYPKSLILSKISYSVQSWSYVKYAFNSYYHLREVRSTVIQK
jgi:hypothetical protein